MDMQFCASANFGPVFNFTHGQGVTAMQYPEGQYNIYPGFHGLPYMYGSQPSNDFTSERNLGDGKTESKPRLSKEEVEKLEKIFQENPKPSSSTKAQLADELGLERPRINNWFQNRRAKAKQERRQEEYEARRTAEKTGSEPNTPLDTPSGPCEPLDQDAQPRMKPSSALFPDMSAAAKMNETADSDQMFKVEDACDSDSLDSPFTSQQADEQNSADLQSPLSLDLPRSDVMGFAYPRPEQNFNAPSSIRRHASFTVEDTLPSPQEQVQGASYQSDHYLEMVGTSYPSSALSFFPASSIAEEHELEDMQDDLSQSPLQSEQNTPSMPQGIPTPNASDSFKSPPPPANIASRRNIPRPATLQVGPVRSRSYNLGSGPRTGMDGPRRSDATSPATAMRRIASASGSMAGRIQKSSSGPRSPLFLGRNTEAYLQFHSRSSMGVLSAALSGAAPPTPMTPVIMNPAGAREPTVSSTCSDDDAFILGQGMPSSIMHELKGESLKTPPETPGVLSNLAAPTFNGNPFGSSIDFTAADQPLLTPYFQTEFPDMSLQNIPSYVELSDNSLPSTPLYTNMNSTIQDAGFFGAPTAGNTQYDWDANESITSSRSSPGQPRARHIQFTPNITPQDYNIVQER
ncbi:hypothetical protein BX600DRAFT_197516 [Xylariales sp. PMI_506]|nr:hypothetical protein BX600DRAFT_197516 [Xylariales sp. PMI_506]